MTLIPAEVDAHGYAANQEDEGTLAHTALVAWKGVLSGNIIVDLEATSTNYLVASCLISIVYNLSTLILIS